MTHRHRRSLSWTLVLSLAFALTALAAPAAQAAKPIRTVLGPVDPFVVPAGFGCSFDVHVAPGADIRRIITEFDDGRVQSNVHGTAVLTNVETGATFTHFVQYHGTDIVDTATNQLITTTDGQVNFYLWPGDQGPYGEVPASGAIYRFTGRIEATLDLDTFVVTSFQYAGTVEDVCASLS